MTEPSTPTHTHIDFLGSVSGGDRKNTDTYDFLDPHTGADEQDSAHTGSKLRSLRAVFLCSCLSSCLGLAIGCAAIFIQVQHRQPEFDSTVLSGKVVCGHHVISIQSL